MASLTNAASTFAKSVHSSSIYPCIPSSNFDLKSKIRFLKKLKLKKNSGQPLVLLHRLEQHLAAHFIRELNRNGSLKVIRNSCSKPKPKCKKTELFKIVSAKFYIKNTKSHRSNMLVNSKDSTPLTKEEDHSDRKTKINLRRTSNISSSVSIPSNLCLSKQQAVQSKVKIQVDKESVGGNSDTDSVKADNELDGHHKGSMSVRHGEPNSPTSFQSPSVIFKRGNTLGDDSFSEGGVKSFMLLNRKNYMDEKVNQRSDDSNADYANGRATSTRNSSSLSPEPNTANDRIAKPQNNEQEVVSDISSITDYKNNNTNSRNNNSCNNGNTNNNTVNNEKSNNIKSSNSKCDKNGSYQEYIDHNTRNNETRGNNENQKNADKLNIREYSGNSESGSCSTKTLDEDLKEKKLSFYDRNPRFDLFSEATTEKGFKIRKKDLKSMSTVNETPNKFPLSASDSLKNNDSSSASVSPPANKENTCSALNNDLNKCESDIDDYCKQSYKDTTRKVDSGFSCSGKNACSENEKKNRDVVSESVGIPKIILYVKGKGADKHYACASTITKEKVKEEINTEPLTDAKVCKPSKSKIESDHDNSKSDLSDRVSPIEDLLCLSSPGSPCLSELWKPSDEIVCKKIDTIANIIRNDAPDSCNSFSDSLPDLERISDDEESPKSMTPCVSTSNGLNMKKEENEFLKPCLEDNDESELSKISKISLSYNHLGKPTAHVEPYVAEPSLRTLSRKGKGFYDEDIPFLSEQDDMDFLNLKKASLLVEDEGKKTGDQKHSSKWQNSSKLSEQVIKDYCLSFESKDKKENVESICHDQEPKINKCSCASLSNKECDKCAIHDKLPSEVEKDFKHSNSDGKFAVKSIHKLSKYDHEKTNGQLKNWKKAEGTRRYNRFSKKGNHLDSQFHKEADGYKEMKHSSHDESKVFTEIDRDVEHNKTKEFSSRNRFSDHKNRSSSESGCSQNKRKHYSTNDYKKEHRVQHHNSKKASSTNCAKYGIGFSNLSSFWDKPNRKSEPKEGTFHQEPYSYHETKNNSINNFMSSKEKRKSLSSRTKTKDCDDEEASTRTRNSKRFLGSGPDAHYSPPPIQTKHKRKPRSLSIDSALSLFKVRVENSGLVLPLRRSMSAINLKYSNAVPTLKSFEESLKEPFSNNPTSSISEKEPSIQNSEMNKIENDVRKTASIEAHTETVKDNHCDSAEDNKPLVIEVSPLSMEYKLSLREKKRRKKLQDERKLLQGKESSEAKSEHLQSKKQQGKLGAKEKKPRSSRRGSLNAGIDSVQEEINEQIRKHNDREKGRRLAQELPGFNWLEEKIRNASAPSATSNSSSTPLTSANNVTTYSKPNRSNSCPSEEEFSPPKNNLRPIPELLPAVNLPSKSSFEILPFYLTKPDNKRMAPLETQKLNPADEKPPTEGGTVQKAPSKETDKRSSSQRNLPGLIPKKRFCEEERNQASHGKFFTHLQTVVTPMTPTLKPLPKLKPSPAPTISIPSQTHELPNDVKIETRRLSSEEPKPESSPKSTTSSQSENMIPRQPSPDEGRVSITEQKEGSSKVEQIAARENSALQVIVKSPSSLEDGINKNSESSSLHEGNQNHSDSNDSNNCIKLSILKEAFKKKLAILQNDSNNPPSSLSLENIESPKINGNDSVKCDDSGITANKEPHSVIITPHKESSDDSMRSSPDFLKAESITESKAFTDCSSQNSNNSQFSRDVTSKSFISPMEEPEKPVLISIPETLPSIESVLRGININDSHAENIFSKSDKKEFETQTPLLIAALYDELLRTRQEVEKLRKVQEQMLNSDSILNARHSKCHTAIETIKRETPPVIDITTGDGYPEIKKERPSSDTTTGENISDTHIHPCSNSKDTEIDKKYDYNDKTDHKREISSVSSSQEDFCNPRKRLKSSTENQKPSNDNINVDYDLPGKQPQSSSVHHNDITNQPATDSAEHSSPQTPTRPSSGPKNESSQEESTSEHSNKNQSRSTKSPSHGNSRLRDLLGIANPDLELVQSDEVISLQSLLRSNNDRRETGNPTENKKQYNKKDIEMRDRSHSREIFEKIVTPTASTAYEHQIQDNDSGVQERRDKMPSEGTGEKEVILQTSTSYDTSDIPTHIKSSLSNLPSLVVTPFQSKREQHGMEFNGECQRETDLPSSFPNSDMRGSSKIMSAAPLPTVTYEQAQIQTNYPTSSYNIRTGSETLRHASLHSGSALHHPNIKFIHEKVNAQRQSQHSIKEDRKYISFYHNGQKGIEMNMHLSPHLGSSKNVQQTPQTFQPKIIIPPNDKDLPPVSSATNWPNVESYGDGNMPTSQEGVSLVTPTSLSYSKSYNRSSAFGPTQSYSFRGADNDRMVEIFPVNQTPSVRQLNQQKSPSIQHHSHDAYIASQSNKQMEKMVSARNTPPKQPPHHYLTSKINQNHSSFYPPQQSIYQKGHSIHGSPQSHLPLSHQPPPPYSSQQHRNAVHISHQPLGNFSHNSVSNNSSNQQPITPPSIPNPRPHSHKHYNFSCTNYQGHTKQVPLSQGQLSPHLQPSANFQNRLILAQGSGNHLPNQIPSNQPPSFNMPPPTNQTIVNQQKMLIEQQEHSPLHYSQPEYHPPMHSDSLPKQSSISPINPRSSPMSSSNPSSMYSTSSPNYSSPATLSNSPMYGSAPADHSQNPSVIRQNKNFQSDKQIQVIKVHPMSTQGRELNDFRCPTKTETSPSSPNKKKCLMCPQQAQFLCSGCKTAWYCSKDCQRNHWGTHSSNCTLRR